MPHPTFGRLAFFQFFSVVDRPKFHILESALDLTQKPHDVKSILLCHFSCRVRNAFFGQSLVIINIYFICT